MEESLTKIPYQVFIIFKSIKKLFFHSSHLFLKNLIILFDPFESRIIRFSIFIILPFYYFAVLTPKAIEFKLAHVRLDPLKANDKVCAEKARSEFEKIIEKCGEHNLYADVKCNIFIKKSKIIINTH